jgi:hypothetical protein
MGFRTLPAVVLLVAATALVTSVGWAIAQGNGDGGWLMHQRASTPADHHAPSAASELDRGMTKGRVMMRGSDGGVMGHMSGEMMRGSDHMMRSPGHMMRGSSGMNRGSADGMMGSGMMGGADGAMMGGG